MQRELPGAFHATARGAFDGPAIRWSQTLSGRTFTQLQSGGEVGSYDGTGIRVPQRELPFRLVTVCVAFAINGAGSNIRPVISVLNGASEPIAEISAGPELTTGRGLATFAGAPAGHSWDGTGPATSMSGELPPDLIILPDWKLHVWLAGIVDPTDVLERIVLVTAPPDA